MKRIITVLIVLLMSTSISAQLDFGVKAGITSSSLKAEETLPAAINQNFDELKVQATNAKFGFQGGIFARVSLLGVFIQPELLLSSGGGEVTIQELNANKDVINEVVKEQSYNKLDLPVMAGFKLAFLRLQVGPIGSLMLSNKSALADYDGYEQKFRSMTWGYQAGIGMDIFKKLTLDLKYEGSLSKLGNGVEINGQDYDFDSRVSQFVFNVGILF
ncbi:porin family protein [Bacteroidota bacterium]